MRERGREPSSPQLTRVSQLRSQWSHGCRRHRRHVVSICAGRATGGLLRRRPDQKPLSVDNPPQWGCHCKSFRRPRPRQSRRFLRRRERHLRFPRPVVPHLAPPGSRGKRGVVTLVIPFLRGSAWEQPPPDLASYLYKNRIVYLGMTLVPSVMELILAEFLYLQYEDADKPIYLYINSTGTTKGGEKLGYETEAFAIYDVMRYVKPPIFTLCVGNAWGEAALILASGARGNRAALPSSTIMIKEPVARFQGQATDIELARKEVKNVKAELVNLYSRHIGKPPEQIEQDIRRPKYFSPSEAVDCGIIDKVLYNKRAREDRGVVADVKKAQLI